MFSMTIFNFIMEYEIINPPHAAKKTEHCSFDQINYRLAIIFHG